MSNVFTYTTEIKQNKDNQLLVKYISDYLALFNKIQRITFYRIKKSFIEHGKLTSRLKSKLYAELKDEFNLTSRAIDSIIANMAGRFEALKELKEYEYQKLHYEQVEQHQQEIRKIRHDMKNQIAGIYGYLEKGEIDLLFGANLVDAETYNKFKDKEGFGGAMSDPVSTRMLLINTADATVGDLNVRKAIEHAINKKEISEGIFDGIETPADTILDKTLPYADISLTPYEYNIQKSETLLEEAGWKKSNSSKFIKSPKSSLLISKTLI